MSNAQGVRRALLIGSQTGGLEGVEGDVERMSEALGKREFQVSKCTAGSATRTGILSSYEQLIDDTADGDAVCVYYSGHGGRISNPYQRGPSFLQYLVPTDHTPDTFRGVLSFELSALLARLTAKTRNVTVILDCCYAGQMSRGTPSLETTAGGLTLINKAIAGTVTDAQLKELLEASNAAAALSDVESNPHALRLVAAEPHRSAFEGRTAQGVSSGVFTSALLKALSELEGRAASWNSVMLQVREQVMRLKDEQRPDAEGPRRRQPWSLTQLPDERPLALFFDGGEAKLRGGALFGAVKGSRYGIMPAGSERYVAQASLAQAVVVESMGSTSRVQIEAEQHVQLGGPGLAAFPLSVPFRKCRVGLGQELSPELCGLVASSRYLTPVALDASEMLPSLSQQGTQLVLRDAAGLILLRAPLADAAQLLERLEFLARAEDLRAFAPGRLEVDLGIELGRVVNGRCVTMPQPGTLHVGDRQYISILNQGCDTVYVAVFGIDPQYTIRLLSRRAARGQMLRPTQSLLLGQNAKGVWQGVEVSWPERLATDEPRPESVIVIAADDEQDFPLLTTGDAYDLKLACEQRVVDEAPQKRGQRAARGKPLQVGSEYSLTRFDYTLSPKPRSS